MVLNVGIIGVGRWGKNLLRVFSTIATVKACAVHSQNLDEAKKNAPHAKWTHDYFEILNDPTIDAVAIATPIPTHYKIVKQALEANKHVFVEKPICETPEEAEELAALAKKKKKILMVGHVFVHNPVYEQLQKINQKDPFKHVQTEWNKLGTFRESIIDNLVSHEVALSVGFFSQSPDSAKIICEKGIATQTDDIHVVLSFSKNRTHLIHVNRVHPLPCKIVQIITASGKLYYWNQNVLSEFDSKTQQFKVIFTSSEEPLQRECSAFLRAIETGKLPLTDAVFGARVVQVLSMLRKG